MVADSGLDETAMSCAMSCAVTWATPLPPTKHPPFRFYSPASGSLCYTPIID